MKKLIITSIVFFVIAMTTSPMFAQQDAKLAQVGMAFLDIPVGTRAAAMGGAYVSVCDDANSMFWNPAGMALVTDREIIFNYNGWIADIKHYSGALAANIGNFGVFGVSVIMMDYGQITGTRVAANEAGYEIIGDLTPSEYAFSIAYARRFSDKFSFGANVKYVSQDLGKSQSGYTATEVHEVENTLSALAVDFGTAFYTGFKDLRVSMSVRNFSREIGYHEEDFPMPLTFSFGMAMDVLSLTKLGEIHKLTLAIDAIHPRDYPERFNLGMEYWVGDLFAIRAGYKTVTDEEGLSAGLGFKKTLGSMDVKIDYSYSDFGLFESVHRTSVGFGF